MSQPLADLPNQHQVDWEQELVSFLQQLSEVQEASLRLLERKRKALASWEPEKLAELAADEEQIISQLRECQERRRRLLELAKEYGIEADSVRGLVRSLPSRWADRGTRSRLMRETHRLSGQARLLVHQSLLNWVIAQRAIIHLSQVLEIIATGGQLQPTYGKKELQQSGGSLVDQVA